MVSSLVTGLLTRSTEGGKNGTWIQRFVLEQYVRCHPHISWQIKADEWPANEDTAGGEVFRQPGRLATVRGSPCAENPSFRLNDRQEVQEEDTQLRWQR